MSQSYPPDQSLDPEHWDTFRAQAHAALDHALDNLQQVRERPVWQVVPEAVKQELAAFTFDEPAGTAQTLADVERLILPYATGNIHPRFFGWVQGSGTPGGVLATALAASMNSNVGGRDHGAVYVERTVVDWARRVFGLPEGAGGMLLSGTSMATLVALGAARTVKAGFDVREDGLRTGPELVVYTSTAAHMSVEKACELLGLGRRSLVRIPVDDHDRMDVRALDLQIAADLAAGRQPFCVVATAGTVDAGAFDDLQAISAVCHAHQLWLHVDGAFGAWLRIVPEQAHQVAGIELADSLAFDFHKWLHVPYDAGCVLVRKRAHLEQTFAAPVSYLARGARGLAGANPWFCDLGPELSRGFRALSVWFTLREHGSRRLGEKVLENCRQAQYLAAHAPSQPHLRVMAPVASSVVCLRFMPEGLSDDVLDALNADIVADLQEHGWAAPSTTRRHDHVVIRVNITNHRTRLEDLDALLHFITASGTARLATLHSGA